MASWSYDGANTVQVTITDATVGWQYKLGCWDATGTTVETTATSSTVTLSITDLTGSAGLSAIVWFVTDGGDGTFPGTGPEYGYTVDTICVICGTSGVAPRPSGLLIGYDGASTISVSSTDGGNTYVGLVYEDNTATISDWNDSVTITGGGAASVNLSATPGSAGKFTVDIENDGPGDIAAAVFTYGVAGGDTIIFPTVLEAEDDLDGDPAHAGTVGTSPKYATAGTSPEEDVNNDPDTDWFTSGQAHSTFYVRGSRLPAAGTYAIQLLVRGSTNGSTFNSTFWAVVRRNGVQITPTARIVVNFSADTWVSLNPPFDASDSNNFGSGPTVYPVASGDVYEFAIFQATPSGTTVAIDKIKFVPVTSGGSSGTSVPMLKVPEPVAGTTWAAGDIRANPSTADRIYCMDMCITDNGDVYCLWAEATDGVGFSSKYVAKKYVPGTGWSTITTDMLGKGGTQIQWCTCTTDGTNVFFEVGDEDGTSVSGAGKVAGNNQVWRVYKWNGSTLTQLGTGQRAIQTRTTAYANVSDDISCPRIVCSPGGTPWVFWGENPDSTLPSARSTVILFAKAAYWDGTAWQYVAPPQTGYTGTVYTTNWYSCCFITDEQQFGVCFRDHTGTVSENPSLLFSYTHAVPSVFDRSAFVYQEYDGAGGWTNILDFRADEVWTDMRHLSITSGNWGYGVDLIDFQGKVWLKSCTGFGTAGASQGIFGPIKADGSAFELPSRGKFWDRPMWDSDQAIPSGAVGTGCTPLVDDNGDLWILAGTQFGLADENFGSCIIGYRETGTKDGWSMAHYDPWDRHSGGLNMGFGNMNNECMTPFACHGSTFYTLQSLYNGAASACPLVLLSTTYDTPYVPFAPGGGSSTPTAGAHFAGRIS